jgi:hypothetical protein
MEESWENRRDDERAGFEARPAPWTYWLPALFGVLLIAVVLLVVLAVAPELSAG